jgi:hypothetical protein
MTKLANLDKNSFSLLELIISIFILSIVIIGFARHSYYDSFDKEYMSLNNIENSFTTKNYSTNFSINNTSIKIIKNDSDIQIINLKKVTYENDKISIFKYEL